MNNACLLEPAAVADENGWASPHGTLLRLLRGVPRHLPLAPQMPGDGQFAVGDLQVLALVARVARRHQPPQHFSSALSKRAPRPYRRVRGMRSRSGNIHFNKS